MSVSSMVSDPEFQKLPPDQQQAALSQLDPAFKKLSGDDFSGVVTGLQKHALSRPDLAAPPAAAGPHVEMEQNILGKPAQNATLPPDAQIRRNGKLVAARMSDLTPEERNQAVEYHEEDPEFGKHTYEGAKSALLATTAPLAVPLESAAVLPTILGLAGGTAGSYGGSKLAKKAGASEFEQEVAGDVGGLAGGVLGAESPSLARAVKSGVQSGVPVRAAARGTQSLLVDPLTDTATAAVKPFVKGYRAIRDINTPVDEILPIELPKPKVPGQDYGIPTVRAAKGTVGRDYVPIPTEPTPAAKPAGSFGRIAYGERTPFEPKAEGLVDNSHVPESNEPIPAAKQPGLGRIEYADPTEYEPEITPKHVKSTPGTSMGDLTDDERDLIQTIRSESKKASGAEGFRDTAETADDVNQAEYAGKVSKGRAMKANANKADFAGRVNNVTPMGNEPVTQLHDFIMKHGTPEHLSSGGEASVFDLNNGKVARVAAGPAQELPNIPEVLQPIEQKTVKGATGDYHASIFPKVETEGITAADVKSMTKSLADQGYQWDAERHNLGRTPKGDLVVIDPGGLEPVAGKLESAREPGLQGNDYKEHPPATAQDVQTARNIVKDHSEQELIKAGKKYGVDHEDYDFKKRDANRHRVERDQFVNDVVDKMPDADIQKLVESEAAFDDKDSNVFDQPSRNSASRAERAKAIWDKATRPKVRTEAEAVKAGYSPEEVERGEHLLPVSGGSGVGEGLGNSGNSPPFDHFSDEAHAARQTALGKTQEYQDLLAPEDYKPQRAPEDLSDQFIKLRDPDQQRADRFNTFTHRNGPLIPDVDTPARLENMHRRAYAAEAPEGQFGKIPPQKNGPATTHLDQTPFETVTPRTAETPLSQTNRGREIVGREGIPGRKTVRDVEDLIPVEMNRVNQALGKIAPASKPWESPGVVSDIKTRTTRPGSIVEDENVLPADRVELPRTTDAQVKERALANRTRANAEVTRLEKAGMGKDEPAMKKALEAKRSAELLYQKSLRKTKLQSDNEQVLLPENRPEPAFGSAYRRR